MKLPLFPLQTVFFPGETVPLHIFEDRYKQLILECKDEAATFGIPVYIYDAVAFGVEVQLVDIVTTYENGDMDISCVARQVFKVNSFNNQMPGKSYPGGDITFLDIQFDASDMDKVEILNKIEVLYKLMEVPFDNLPIARFNSYVLAHKIGMSMEQEYQLLQLERESERLNYLNIHLNNTIAVLKEVGRTKKTIKLNGAFKNFDPLDFEIED